MGTWKVDLEIWEGVYALQSLIGAVLGGHCCTAWAFIYRDVVRVKLILS